MCSLPYIAILEPLVKLLEKVGLSLKPLSRIPELPQMPILQLLYGWLTTAEYEGHWSMSVMSGVGSGWWKLT